MKKVLVLGCGALGSNLVANLASDLRNEIELTVLDFDTVEQRNVQAGTQFYMPDQIGQNKVDALQYNIYKWFGKEIKTLNEKFVGQIKDWTQYDLTVDCFDNQMARLGVQQWYNITKELLGKGEKKRYAIQFDTLTQTWTKEKEELVVPVYALHCGFSPKMTFEISWADNYEVPEDSKDPIDICEMRGAGSFVKMVASVASRTIVHFLETEEKKYFIGNRFSVREIV